MLLRILALLLAQGAGGALGWLLARGPGVAAGAILGAILFVLVDSWRGHRFIRWAKEPDTSAPPVIGGLWGEAAYRITRALRIQERKASDGAQRLQEFLAAVQASPNGVIVLDQEGRIEWCNHIAAEHFGIHPQRDVLQHVGNLVRDPAFMAYMAGQEYDREVKLLGRHHSTARPVKLSVQLHPYGDGHKLMLSRDITALAQADAMRRDFVANVSHEIRTPLTVLAGFIETMQSLPLSDAERSRYLDLMSAQAGRMQTLVQDLLMLSRLEGSPLPSVTDRVDLAALMAQCEAEARGLSNLLHPDATRPQQVVFGPAPPFALAGSASELRSAASNLVNNAVRYTPAGGSIDVRWERLPDGGVRLAVTDTGPGIPAEHIPRLGERFYRLDRSRSRESGGTGLGLAIAKHVAQRHGGELQITSQQGRGSCFALMFPAQRVHALVDVEADFIDAS